jgi:hypothetical protein
MTRFSSQRIKDWIPDRRSRPDRIDDVPRLYRAGVELGGAGANASAMAAGRATAHPLADTHLADENGSVVIAVGGMILPKSYRKAACYT